MAGKPYKVGRFAHTLRVHLMKEHVGIDVDAIDEPDLTKNEPVESEQDQKPWDPENEQNQGVEDGVTHVGHRERRTAAASAMHDATEAVSEGT
jgi:phospholipase D1/2